MSQRYSLLAPLLLILGGCGQLQQLTGGNNGGGDNPDATQNGNQGKSTGGGLFSGVTGGGDDNGGGKLEIGTTKTQAGGLISDAINQGPPPGVTWSQCNDVTDGGPVNGPDCITAEVKCGETVVGHTRGGVKYYNTKFYEKHYCWPATVNRSGGDERVYRFVVDESGINHRFNFRITFDSPCAELDIALIEHHDTKNRCPQMKDHTQVCDVLNRKGKSRVVYKQTTDPGEVWFFVVEGRDQDEGPFSFTLECLNDPAYNYFEDEE